MKLRVALFDLDDTLYPEMEFVMGGFRAVAAFLEEYHDLDSQKAIASMTNLLAEKGRGSIFQTLLETHGLLSEELIKTLLHVYRTHSPKLSLYSDVRPLFTALRQAGIPIGLITDGLASVQQRKISALRLNTDMDVILCTDELGQDCCKPSIIPFQVALHLLKSRPEEGVYVGDNPKKDFYGAKLLGLHTVQLARQGTAPITLETAYAADRRITGLQDLMPILEEGVQR